MNSTVAVAILVAVAGRLMAEEAKAWFAWLPHKLRRTAVWTLPVELRKRYDEEWESGLEEVPGDICKVIYSLGFLCAAVKLCNIGSHNLASLSIKRAFDFVLAATAILLVAPVFALIAIAIRLETSGPIFTTLNRFGKRGHQFPLIVFRTPTTNRKLTRVGRVLQVSSLDSLPQFINVLRGDMSLVGPHASIAGSEGRRASELRPGLTGLWQLRRDSVHFDLLDEAYAKHWSFWLDLKILVMTMSAPFGTNRGNRGT